MEFVNGVNLSQLVDRVGPLQVSDACSIIQKTATGLAYAHEHGIIHRDIKPANVILQSAVGESLDTQAGIARATVKILDLGLARLFENEPDASITNPGTVMGTVEYMSVEQAMDTRQADQRSDIYSLGCTFYFLLRGRAAHEGNTAMKILMAHREKEVPSLLTLREDIPHEVEHIVRTMMAREPAERYQSADQVVQAIEDISPATHSTAEIKISQTQIQSTPKTHPEIEALKAFIDGCGGPDRFISREEENLIFRKGGELRLSLKQIEAALDLQCKSNEWTRQKTLTEKLSKMMYQATADDGLIDQKEFEQIVGFAVTRSMPRKEANEHCLTLMLDDNWKAKESIFNKWYSHKMRQHGLK